MASGALKIPDAHSLPNLIMDGISPQQQLHQGRFLQQEQTGQALHQSPFDTLHSMERAGMYLTYHTLLSWLLLLELKRLRPREPVSDLS